MNKLKLLKAMFMLLFSPLAFAVPGADSTSVTSTATQPMRLCPSTTLQVQGQQVTAVNQNINNTSAVNAGGCREVYIGSMGWGVAVIVTNFNGGCNQGTEYVAAVREQWGGTPFAAGGEMRVTCCPIPTVSATYSLQNNTQWVPLNQPCPVN